MYAFKKFVALLATPMTMSLVLCAVALLLRWRKRPRTAGWFVALAGTLFYLFSIDPVADSMLGPLEERYARWPESGLEAPHYIVVLGTSYSPRADVPTTSALDHEGLARIVEGVRLCRTLPDCHLVVSGGAPAGRVPSALGYRRMAIDLGVEDRRLTVLDASLDTAAESRAITPVVGSKPFLLVTSASHMPRAMRFMQLRELHALPAPTAHAVDSTSGYALRSLLPNARALLKSERALHEYLGLAAILLGVDG